jgi:integrase
MEDAIIQAWLDSTKVRSTLNGRTKALALYTEFSGMDGASFLAEINAEDQKPRTERLTIEKRLRGEFFPWLQQKKGYSPNSAKAYLAYTMGFYKHHNYRVNIKLSELITLSNNRKVNLTKDDIRKLVSAAKTLRDRAIILVLYQSGMDLATLRSLKVRDVQRGLESGEVPLRLNLQRRKEGVEYHSFISTDAIEAVRAYLQERMRRDKALDPESPLFIREKVVKEWTYKDGVKRKRSPVPEIANSLVEKFFREIAVEAKLISAEEIATRHFNAVHPHCLRTAFATAMRNSGADFGTIEFFLGHKLPGAAGAYIGDVDQAYVKAMTHLSIYGSVSQVVDLQIKTLSEEVTSLKSELSSIKAFLTVLKPMLNDVLMDEDSGFRGFSDEEKTILAAELKKR